MTKIHAKDAKTILLFEALDRAALSTAGGKSANLGELPRAGFSVPPGFCVSMAAYDIVAREVDPTSTLNALAATPPGDTARL